MFTLDEVTVRRGEATLLDRVTTTVRCEGCTAIVGPSGAGKSTLLRLLNRLEEPTSGLVRYRDVPVRQLNVLQLRRRVSLVGQRPVLLTDVVLDDLRVGAPELSEADGRRLLHRVGLPEEFALRSTATLSGGEAQRVCLARALAVSPEVLLLDEPTSSLDDESAAAVERTIRELVDSGVGCLLVTHSAGQARRLADCALVLTGGRLIEDGPPAGTAYLGSGP